MDLANECNEVAQALLQGIQKVTVCPMPDRPGEPKPKLRSMCAALKLVWSSKYLNKLRDRLSRYREEISLRLLVIVNTHQRLQSQKLDQLKQGNQDVVEVLSVQCNTLRLKLEENHRHYTQLLHTDREAAEKRHAETIAAILTSQDGQSRTITCPQSFQNLLKESVNSGQSFMARTFRGNRVMGSLAFQDYDTTSTVELTRITDGILNALEFREMSERHSMIEKAYDYTFEWVFDDPRDDGKQWSNFAQWLKSGAGCYWINGKAGSGKSTLMKYINDHESTSAALKRWAGPDQLFIGAFFFYYNGTALQKSQTGLLRSLLLSVLRQKRELVPVLFPNVIRALFSGQQQLPLELTVMELRTAFTTLIETELLDMKVCFIIDGLDEYDGDHEDLAKLFALATKFDRVKLLLSSRPIPACVYAFSSCPKLRLQDLTYDDIRYFADSELGQHPLMQQLERATSGATAELVGSIVSKASGVFLWVDVVVKLLIRRLMAYDTLSDLRRRLDDLPEQLEKLYSHMLRSMSKENRAQGSAFLQLMLKSSKTHGRFPMTTLQLSFAEEQDYERCFNDKPSVLSEKEENWRLESTEGRLRSRCCGLLEVQDPPDRLQEKAGCVVGFLHRTVVEFLEDPYNWHEITSWTEGTHFNATKALLSSSLSEMKAMLIPREDRNDGALAFRSAARILTLEATLESGGQKLCREVFIPNMVTTLFLLWGEKERGRCSRFGLNVLEKLVTTAGFHCTEAQLEPLLDVCDGSAVPSLADRSSRAHIAAYLLSECIDEVSVPTRALIIRGIMGCRGDPNEPISFRHTSRRFWNDRYRLGVHDDHTATWTLWEFLLHYIHGAMDPDFLHLVRTGATDTVFDLIISLLENGGDRDATITLERKTRSSSSPRFGVQSASELVEKFCSYVWDARDSNHFSTDAKCPNTTGQPLTMASLAKKAARIESLFISDHAQMYGTVGTTELGASKGTRANNLYPRRPLPQGNRSTTVAQNNLDYSHNDLSRNWTRSPWKDYQCSESTSPPASNHPNPIPTAHKPAQWESQWWSTRRADRFRLLNADDQELARQASRQDLNARDQRKCLSEIMKRPKDLREKILQCGEALRKARDTPERAVE